MTAIGLGIVLFASTNVDDILLLAAFFADSRLTPRAIVVGQFVGIAALVMVSTAAALAAIVVPPAWIALLGVVPLFLGVRQLLQLRRGAGASGELENVKVSGQVLERRRQSQVLAVASVTVANGADNLGVYVPVFSADVQAIPTYIAIFAVMTAVWCFAGHALVNNPVSGDHVRRYGHLLLPFVLIGLGVMILRDAAPLLW